jgi:uncharacterized membrane protein
VNARWLRSLRIAAIAVCVLGYALLAHYSNSHADAQALGAALAIAPPLAIAVAFAWRSRYRLPALAACVLAGVLVFALWPLIERNFVWAYLAQQSGAYALLSFSFARTLFGERVPLCTRWADMVHGPLSPPVARYTRQVTAAWAVLFAFLTLSVLGLFWFAPLRVWSAYSNFVTGPLIIVMFIGEYAVRRAVLPPLRRTSVFDAVRAYMGSARRADAPRH